MTVKLERMRSMLKELLIEALSHLDDERINSVSITDVECSKGKYNAKVFVQIDNQDALATLKILKKAEGILREYVLSNSGWFKCPHLQFVIDESLEKSQGIEAIFRQINEEKLNEEKFNEEKFNEEKLKHTNKKNK